MKPSTERELYGPEHRSAKPIPKWAIALLALVGLTLVGIMLASLAPTFRQDAIDADELPGVTEPNPPD